MKLFQWEKGRQNSGYNKMPLFLSEKLKCDFYLLKFPVGCSVPTHTDPVKDGFDHYRINFTLIGHDFRTRMYVLGPAKKFWRFVMLRPDLYKHGLPAVTTDTYMLSFGWLRKKAS